MSRGSQRYCRYGHDTWETLRYSNRTCRLCNRRYRFENEVRKLGGLPAYRIREVVRQRCWDDDTLRRAFADRWGIGTEGSRKALERLMKRDRVSEDLADRWCLTLGTSLAAVYPELYVVRSDDSEQAAV